MFESDGRFLVSHCCDLALLFGGIGIGKRTPAEAAGIIIQRDDKWITFIHNAALSAA